MVRRSYDQEPDEDVLLEARPHWCQLAPVTAGGTGLLLACVAGFLFWRGAPVWFAWVLLAGVVGAVALIGGKVLAWRATGLLITTTRVVHRSGLLRRVGREIPVTRVQDVTYSQGLVGRVFGVGSVTVESAGASPAEAFQKVRRPAEVQRILNRAVEGAVRGGSGSKRGGAGQAGLDLVAQIDRLDGLRRRGVVTDAEFEAKKAELLARM